MLVLSRKAGQSVRVGEYLVTVLGTFERRGCRVRVVGPGCDMTESIYPGVGIDFGGGTLWGGKRTQPGHTALAFDFPRDVRIDRC